MRRGGLGGMRLEIRDTWRFYHPEHLRAYCIENGLDPSRPYTVTDLIEGGVLIEQKDVDLGGFEYEVETNK